MALGQSGALPAALQAQQTNSQNQAAGPFLNALPSLPGGWDGLGHVVQVHDDGGRHVPRLRQRRQHRGGFGRRHDLPVTNRARV
jgi:hypothetical protein